jgi:replicative DNA helicase
MDKQILIKRILGIVAADANPENIIELTSLIDQYDRSAAKQASLAEKTAAYLFRDTPPYSEELEKKFLGSILINPDAAMVKVRPIFREGLIYDPANNWIADSIQRLWDKQLKITVQSIAEDLRNTDFQDTNVLEHIGGQYVIDDLLFGVSNWAECEDYGQDLLKYWTKRTMIDLASEMIQKMSRVKLDEVHDLRVTYQAALHELVKSLDTSYGVVDSIELSKLLLDHIAMLHERRKQAEDEGIPMVVGVPTALHSLDKLVGGWKPSELIIIQARPGMGKTGYILSEIEVALEAGESILIFSMEMSALQLGKRLISMGGYIDSDALRTGHIYDSDLQKFHGFLEWLDGKGIYIIDKPNRRIEMMREAALTYKTQYGISRIYVDYLQLAKGDQRGNREKEVSSIARGLKNIAKEAYVPVIALSQLSRSVETRGGDKRPQLSDARESGEIEQAADVVASLYRPEYYQIMEDVDGRSLKGIGEVIPNKQREGPSGLANKVEAKFDSGKWSNMESEEASPEEELPEPPEGFNPILPPSKMNDDEDIPW